MAELPYPAENVYFKLLKQSMEYKTVLLTKKSAVQSSRAASS